ncbi:MAG: efflux RND transporter periplasmic adaptor subunit [Hoeflea sp.]|uniref:efflux RND transporter periplasmic adaptor subunit n=1 Tax=Hoeflea sp. TaxID=1940281 RepID=UPI001D3FBFB3|nr:efflux RND transporter periplasmic adaptor subunit [Hoeflea sp.]MBU4529915.1 efflux RND transporter periplasmic adaptor subunit [Alphaproteobacteria bacterium]MBU4547064.1 efflux RND transporter periplasmic adaptor subunit [Alphaproteobacteria bacterium]MBU4548677.1 efflux RND transporter periplasmic adaptor subunit [Alphaproteobacteria bacterium]MBV1722408.1 efflux RND transporter periplasmic adaptor subunit [Hoeflea sp.]MBV1762436.1 efflux RND transporter periplasmic adaptor subunit [Hoef
MRLARYALFCSMLVALTPSAAPAQQQERPPAAVTVVTLKAQTVTVTSTLPGRVVASGVAEVRPQVNGIIIERLFEEGSAVNEGDILYRIDPATYRAQVVAAQAAVNQAEVSLKSANRELTRMESLRKSNVASEQALDAAVTTRDIADAALQVAKAQLLAANIDLERTTIRAQLSGAIGRSLTTQGALIISGQSAPLAVIRKLDPVYVDVAQSAADLVRWKRQGPQAAGENIDTKVELMLADRTIFDHTGELTAAEPHVDEQTGVITLRLQFPNPDEMLLPGMYVQVEMPQGVIENAILVPQEGVSRDRRGAPTAMVVGPDNIVEQRTLTIVSDRGSDWIVTDGVKAGEKVIVAGLQKIAAGATVAPEERAEQPAQN